MKFRAYAKFLAVRRSQMPKNFLVVALITIISLLTGNLAFDLSKEFWTAASCASR